MRAVALSCTLNPTPATSNTEALTHVLLDALGRQGVETELIRVVDHDVRPGVESDMGDGDEWPAIRQRIVTSEILVLASPTWLGKPSSVAQRVLERMDAMLGETDDAGRPVAYNRVAGCVVTGNEDGAHHVITEIAGGLIDMGFTVPGQSWTYWNKGPGPGAVVPRQRGRTRLVALHGKSGSGEPPRRREGSASEPHGAASGMIAEGA